MFNLEVAGVHSLVRVGLVRGGETEENNTIVQCDGLLLRGSIQAGMGSCAATGVAWQTGNPMAFEGAEAAGVWRCAFRSAGFTVMWGGRHSFHDHQVVVVKAGMEQRNVLIA